MIRQSNFEPVIKFLRRSRTPTTHWCLAAPIFVSIQTLTTIIVVSSFADIFIITTIIAADIFISTGINGSKDAANIAGRSAGSIWFHLLFFRSLLHSVQFVFVSQEEISELISDTGQHYPIFSNAAIRCHQVQNNFLML